MSAPTENEPFVFEGFFKVDVGDSNDVTIRVAPNVTDVKELTSGGVWRQGTVCVSADRNAIDVYNTKAYKVDYSRLARKEELFQQREDIVHYDASERYEVTHGILGLFRTRQVSYLPRLTRYIMDVTGEYAVSSHWYNHALTISVVKLGTTAPGS